jgi:response regulator NasT
MDGKNIFVAEHEPQELEKIKQYLADSEYRIIDCATDGPSAIRKIRMIHPDLVLVDFDLPVTGGLEVAKISEEDHIAPALVMAPISQSTFTDVYRDQWDFAYINKPLTKLALLQAMQLVAISYRRISKLEQEVAKLRDDLEARKDIERAKGILMEVLNLSEKEAFRKMQKQSMDKGMPMRDIARAIIVAYETGK